MQPAYATWILINTQLPTSPQLVLTMEPTETNAWRVAWTRQDDGPHELTFVAADDAKLGVQMAFAMFRNDGWRQLSFSGIGSFDLDQVELRLT